MLRHEDIWNAIDRLAKARGYSASGLARAAGLDPTAFNKSKRFSANRPRWPGTESIAKILDVTGTSFADFVCLVEGAGGTGQSIPVIGRFNSIPLGRLNVQGQLFQGCHRIHVESPAEQR